MNSCEVVLNSPLLMKTYTTDSHLVPSLLTAKVRWNKSHLVVHWIRLPGLYLVKLQMAFMKEFTPNLNELIGKCEETTDKRNGLKIILGFFQACRNDPLLGHSWSHRTPQVCAHQPWSEEPEAAKSSPRGNRLKSILSFIQRQNFHWLQRCRFIHFQETIQQWHPCCSYNGGMENSHILKAISIFLAYGPCTEPLCGSMRVSHAERAQKTCTACAWEGAYAWNS